MGKVVAIHQPNFFPWMGYFYKICNCDIFVFHDDTQLSKNNVTRRVRFNSSNGKWWATVPVLNKGRNVLVIKDVRIDEKQDWREKLERRVIHSYAKSSYFRELSEMFRDCLYYNNDNLAEYNIYGIKQLSYLLEVKPSFIVSSDLNLKTKETEKEIETIEVLRGTTYLSGIGAKSYQQDDLFQNNNIKLIYSGFKESPYKQIHGDFLNGLSIWDVLFNIGLNQTKDLLNS